jgi:hypothetical protein
VPGHTSVEGNEEADSLVKEGTKIQPESQKSSFALLGLLIRQLGQKEWNKALVQYEEKKRDTIRNPASYNNRFP